jgi:hypothetical protein
MERRVSPSTGVTRCGSPPVQATQSATGVNPEGSAIIHVIPLAYYGGAVSDVDRDTVPPGCKLPRFTFS